VEGRGEKELAGAYGSTGFREGHRRDEAVGELSHKRSSSLGEERFTQTKRGGVPLYGGKHLISIRWVIYHMNEKRVRPAT